MNYRAEESRDTVKAHYQKELLSRGWKFCGGEKVIYRGHDYQGEHVFYRKDGYVANIQFAGQQEEEFGWTYSFAMSWGIWDDLRCK